MSIEYSTQWSDERMTRLLDAIAVRQMANDEAYEQAVNEEAFERVGLLTAPLLRGSRSMRVDLDTIRPGDVCRVVDTGEAVRVLDRFANGAWRVRRSIGSIRSRDAAAGSSVVIVGNCAPR